MEQQYAAVTAAGGSILAIAVTATFSQQRFAEELSASYPLLSDWNREVSSAWGVAYDEWKGHQGLAKRSVFVVDRDRVVRYAWVTDDALQLPDLSEAVAVVHELGDGQPVDLPPEARPPSAAAGDDANAGGAADASCAL